VQLFIATFGSSTTRPDVKEADSNGDGKVSRREARRFLEIQAGVRRHDGTLIRSPDGRVYNVALFRQIDSDGNNILGEDEFLALPNVSDQLLQHAQQGDSNKDGRVSFAEWCLVPHYGQFSPVNDFRKLDKNLDARVDKAELLNNPPKWKSQLSASVFPGFDTDSDGLLTLDEYRMTMEANPCVRWHMPIADLDGDHELKFAEFKFDTMRFPLLRWLYFHRLDTNGDGVLKVDEFNFRTKTPDEFFIVNANGTGWRSLFRFETHFACGSPAVSPDGKTLAFDAWSVKPRTSPTIFKMDLGTAKPRKISSGSMPSWSADGKRFVCSQSGVRIINADGWNPMGIADNGWGWGAQWSPDGKSIVFTQEAKINSYDVQTKKVRTNLKKHDYKKIYWNMAWSPDSRFICFKGEKADDTLEVVTLDTFSEEPTLNVHHSTQLNINADFAWHPDGDRLVFGMHCPERTRTQIYEINPHKDEPPTLFPGQDETRNNNDVCWTPDGKQLIVVSGDF
jgi:TolB protein